MTNDDLHWLASERPSAPPLDPAATARARTALLEHVEPGVAEVHQLDQHRTPQEAPRPARRPATRRRPVRVLAMAGAAAAALVIGLAVTGGGTHPEPAEASPLATLSHAVEQSPAPTGDATLVERVQSGPGAPAGTGYDLSLDDGRYFYGSNPDELSQAIDGDAEQDGWLKRVTTSAAAALDLPIEQARKQMADAALDPKVAAESSDEAAADAAKVLAEKKRSTAKPMDPKTHLEANIWSNSLDALVLGSGRPEVRAGVLWLLATCGHVAVVDGTRDGRDTLVLTASHFTDGYQEQLTIDAKTGIPLRFTAGQAGQGPEIVITYHSSRVTASELAHR